MKLFVTGAAGFIGSHFVRDWLTSHPDDEVVSFDALTYAGNLANLGDLSTNPQHRFVRGDITKAEEVAQAIAGCDVVVHFAAETHVDRSISGPAAFAQTNIIGTQILLDVARAANVQRFHHISTDEVFGSLPLDGSKFSENTPYNPHSPYSATKAGSDMLVRAYYDTFELPITITNCSNNYGSYQFPEKLIPLMVLNALEGKALPVYGTGQNIRDWIHVRDHARAVALVIEKGTVGETYCVGGNAERTNLQIIEAIVAQLGVSKDLITFVADRPGHDLRYAIDHSKIQTELGYAPAYTFEQGLAETIQWYVDNQSWWEPIRTGAYKDYYAQQYGQ